VVRDEPIGSYFMGGLHARFHAKPNQVTALSRSSACDGGNLRYSKTMSEQAIDIAASGECDELLESCGLELGLAGQHSAKGFCKRRIWNVDVNLGTQEEILSAVIEALRQNRRGLTVACANPHSQVVASRDLVFKEALNSFDVILADGVGTSMAAKFLGVGAVNRFTGPDFFAAMNNCINSLEKKHTYFFIGSTEHVLQGIAVQMRRQFPNIELAGTYSPPFLSSEELADEVTLEMINKANPSVVWVGMTAPKQELWMKLCSDRLSASVIAGIGAEFDYFAGAKKRPQPWVARFGLQWLYRFLKEPRRTWRRHFVSMPVFVANVLWHKFRGK